MINGICQFSNDTIDISPPMENLLMIDGFKSFNSYGYGINFEMYYWDYWDKSKHWVLPLILSFEHFDSKDNSDYSKISKWMIITGASAARHFYKNFWFNFHFKIPLGSESYRINLSNNNVSKFLYGFGLSERLIYSMNRNKGIMISLGFYQYYFPESKINHWDNGINLAIGYKF